ncbi:MAG: EF-hand domain-containing protein [Candidatus Thalassarchaeaceae archaeon]
MNGGIEAVAIKNLQTILKSRGISSEALFSKYDIDGNGRLSYDEFTAALSSITGQRAPQSIVNAIFSALDSNGDGYIDLQEILVLVDGKTSEPYVEGSSLTISGHPNDIYNGSYELQGELNGKPLFANYNSAKLYYYNAGSGGAPSWSLDNRELDGTQDFYRGGWTRPPVSGGLPTGTRRWVGVGRITIQTAAPPEATPGDIKEVPLGEVVEEVESDDSGDMMDSISAEFSEILGEMQQSQFSDEEAIDKSRAIMDEQAESKISRLPTFLQSSARGLWKAKADSLQEIARSNLVLAATTAATLSAGALGIASISNEQEKLQEAPEITDETNSSKSVVEEKIEEIVAQSEFELEDVVVEESADNRIESEDMTIFSIVESFSQARMLSEQNSLKEELSGTPVDISIKITSVERTFGIGISDRYRGGNTVVASLYDQGTPSGNEVEIRIPSDANSSVYKDGYEGEISCTVSGWNGIRKRIILDS